MTNHRKRSFCGGISALLCVLMIMLFGMLPVSANVPEYAGTSELGGARIGLLTGMPFEELVREETPDIGSFSYFESLPDELIALKSGKIDGIFINNALIEFHVANDDGLAIVPHHYLESNFGFAFQKGDPRRDEWQAVIDRLRADGTIDKAYQIWTGADKAAKVLPEQDWPGAAGTIKVACCDTFEPMSYIGENSKVMGFDVNVVLLVARELDLHVEFEPMAFSMVLAEIESGKADVGIGDIVITEERQKAMDFAAYEPAYFEVMVRSRQVEPELSTFSDFKGKTAAMLTGAPFEDLIREREPGVKGFQYFSSMPDMSMALKSGKIDAMLMNNAVSTLYINRDSSFALFPESLGDSQFGFAFAKGDPRAAEWQAAYEQLGEETVNAVWEKWTGSNDSIKTLPEQTWEGKNGTIRLAACDSLEPMSYMGENGQIIGFDVEILLRMAEVLDYHVEVKGMEFSTLMAEVQSGKSDVACGSIVITDERSELVDFVSYYPASFVLVVRSRTVEAPKTGFLEGLRGSFERTFITEGRWKMIVSGLGMTVLMALTAGLLGTALGFLLVLLRRRNNRIANKLIAGYTGLITGIPVVVILMVLYYIVFGKLNLPAVIVAIIGFSLIFASRAFGVIWNAVGAVDNGQREAALALGYTESASFRKVILPQARPIYASVLRTQFVMLLKETSIAGYITVVDLTKAGDLIRSRTMEAFFPLIMVAAVYFLLTWLLTRLITLIEQRAAKRRNERKIKGVD